MRKIVVFFLVLAVFGILSARSKFNESTIKAELRKPGVKLVAIDFYMTGCPPCDAAIPEWKKLKKQYGDALKLIVVAPMRDNGSCVVKDWRPDKMICDEDIEIAESWGVKDFPQAFLYSWHNNDPLVQHGHVRDVEKAIKTYFKEIPRVVLDADSSSRNLVSMVEEELLKNSKIELVSSAAEQKQLLALKKQSHQLNYDEDLKCELGKEISANSVLKITKEDGNLVLRLSSVEKSCTMAAATKSLSGDKQKLKTEVAAAVYELLSQMFGNISTPDEGAKPAKTQMPVAQSTNSSDLKACEYARSKDNLETWETYLKKFPNGECSFEAEENIKNIKNIKKLKSTNDATIKQALSFYAKGDLEAADEALEGIAEKDAAAKELRKNINQIAKFIQSANAAIKAKSYDDAISVIAKAEKLNEAILEMGSSSKYRVYKKDSVERFVYSDPSEKDIRTVDEIHAKFDKQREKLRKEKAKTVSETDTWLNTRILEREAKVKKYDEDSKAAKQQKDSEYKALSEKIKDMKYQWEKDDSEIEQKIVELENKLTLFEQRERGVTRGSNSFSAQDKERWEEEVQKLNKEKKRRKEERQAILAAEQEKWKAKTEKWNEEEAQRKEEKAQFSKDLKKLAADDKKEAMAKKKEAEQKYEEGMKEIDEKELEQIRAKFDEYKISKAREVVDVKGSDNIYKLKAEAFAKSGIQKLNKKDLIGARRAFAEALRIDRNNQTALDGMNSINVTAKSMYWEAYGMRETNKAKAKKIFTLLTKTLMPSNEFYLKARVALEDLQY